MGEMNPEKILTIDDNESTRYAIRRILSRHGYAIIESATGKEGIHLLEEKPDLVILDISLPDINGFEVCKEIKKNPEYSSTPVLQISANFIKEQDKVMGLDSGADGYLTQPLDSSVLLATVKSLLRIRKAEREHSKLIEALKREQDLREKFIAALTHDLRSPLSAAKLNAQMIVRDSTLTEKTKNQATRVVQNITRIDLMIQDLLDANLLKNGQELPLVMIPCDLTQIANEIFEELHLRHGKRFVMVSDPHIHGIWNENSLKRALENLLTNAAKYGNPLSPITLKLAQHNNTVEISVHNFGNPIAPNDQVTLFDQFRRTESAKVSGTRGWGIGLALVRGVSEAHGGFVKVESNESKGTTFLMTIPKNSRAYETSGRQQGST